MATLRDIKNRIVGVKGTQQITKAMKMVAAAKLRRAQNRIINARPYAREIAQLLSNLVSAGVDDNPFITDREVKNVAVVSVTADRGLCGAFNTNIIREVNRFLNEEIGNDVTANLFCVGKKGFDFFSKRDVNLAGKSTGIFSSLNYSDSVIIADELIKSFLNGTFDKIYIIYNEFKSVIQQKIIVEKFLPIPLDNTRKEKNQIDYIFEPDREYIINYLLPKHLKAQMWRILLESNASELGARMTAMDNATTNAKELIRSLELKYNKERQAAITKEILEIVSGANALRGS